MQIHHIVYRILVAIALQPKSLNRILKFKL